VKSAQLNWSNRPHPRRHAGVQRQDVRADLTKDALGRGLVGHVGGDGGDAEPGADGLQRIGAAGDDGHLCIVGDQGLDQSEAKTPASAGDDDIFVSEAHLFCSRVECQVQLGRSRHGKGVNQRRREAPRSSSRRGAPFPRLLLRN
jgi:hypothetical protein